MKKLDLTISSLHQQYHEGSLTPRSLVEQLNSLAAELEELRIWIHLLTFDELTPYLDELEKKELDELPLYGVPFAIKDNIDLLALPTTAGCPDFAYTPERNAFVVQRLIDAGAIPIGKTNMDQFATGLVGVRSPEPWGPCHNSFNPEYIAGGSSSGSAVAVATGLVSFALGTDTAGSGRVPAAFNNIVGLKPTRGLLSNTGVVPDCRSLQCVSILALTHDDLNTVFDYAAIYDGDDIYARKNLKSNTTAYGLPRHKGFRFAVPQEDQLEFFGNESAARLFNESVECLMECGGEKTVIDFADFLAAARLLYEGPWVAERYVATESLLTDNPDAMLPITRQIIEGARSKTAVDAFKAEYRMQEYRQKCRVLLATVDFILTPTTGTIYTIAEVEADPIRLNSNLGYYTNFMNLLNCAAVATPSGFMENGLPLGVTLFSSAFSDKRLLSFANTLQQALKLPLGATGHPLPASEAGVQDLQSMVRVVVCGAHLEEMPLNWQLTDRGGHLLERTKTAPKYRFYALAGGSPYRPGLIRDEVNGTSIEVEVWELPVEHFGSFVAGIPQPLGIGKLELADGRWENGFICEGYAVIDAQDITHLGGWRKYIAEMDRS